MFTYSNPFLKNLLDEICLNYLYKQKSIELNTKKFNSYLKYLAVINFV